MGCLSASVKFSLCHFLPNYVLSSGTTNTLNSHLFVQWAELNGCYVKSAFHSHAVAPSLSPSLPMSLALPPSVSLSFSSRSLLQSSALSLPSHSLFLSVVRLRGVNWIPQTSDKFQCSFLLCNGLLHDNIVLCISTPPTQAPASIIQSVSVL